MRAFIVELDNRPGELARLADAIGAKGINITAIGAAASKSGGSIGLMTNDEDGTRAALEGAKIRHRAIDVVGATLQDRPGTLAESARRLGEAGVNIELLLVTARSGAGVNVVFGVDDAGRASAALAEMASQPA
jgi:hypothetical protein